MTYTGLPLPQVASTIQFVLKTKWDYPASIFLSAWAASYLSQINKRHISCGVSTQLHSGRAHISYNKEDGRRFCAFVYQYVCCGAGFDWTPDFVDSDVEEDIRSGTEAFHGEHIQPPIETLFQQFRFNSAEPYDAPIVTPLIGEVSQYVVQC